MGTVTADADGQHRAEDVCAVAAALAFGGDALVLGVRDLTLDTVPTRSKIGNRVTSWAFHTLYGVRLEDTQTGLRGIPWERLAWCAAVSGDRYEYEMNVLIRAARDRVALEQVPIQVVYFDNNAGSHLRTVRDAWRVACVLISGLGFYTLCSCFSALTDVLMFWLGSSVLFAALPDAVCYWWGHGHGPGPVLGGGLHPQSHLFRRKVRQAEHGPLLLPLGLPDAVLLRAADGGAYGVSRPSAGDRQGGGGYSAGPGELSDPAPLGLSGGKRPWSAVSCLPSAGPSCG